MAFAGGPIGTEGFIPGFPGFPGFGGGFGKSLNFDIGGGAGLGAGLPGLFGGLPAGFGGPGFSSPYIPVTPGGALAGFKGNKN